MSKVKAAVGIFVMVGVPLGLALVWAGLGVGYANQHVHNVTSIVMYASASSVYGQAIRHGHAYVHSTGGVIAVAGVLAFSWALIAALFVLWGGWMIGHRNERWD